jgi:FtsP/CotA-like multicopper oxidase with cupredoxin domain
MVMKDTMGMENPPNVRVLRQQGFKFTKNVYRIRLLNAFFQALFTDMKFHIFAPNSTVEKGIVPFTVIGTDSNIHAKPTYGVTSFTMSTAERIDILIDLNISSINVGDTIALIAEAGLITEPSPTQYINFTIG